MFAQSRFSNGSGSGSFGSTDRAPVTSSQSNGHAYTQPSFNTYSNNANAQRGFQRGFTQDRDQQFGDERDRTQSFASDHSRDNRENSRGLRNAFGGNRDQDHFRPLANGRVFVGSELLLDYRERAKWASVPRAEISAFSGRGLQEMRRWPRLRSRRRSWRP
jgi:hypothetical protein